MRCVSGKAASARVDVTVQIGFARDLVLIVEVVVGDFFEFVDQRRRRGGGGRHRGRDGGRWSRARREISRDRARASGISRL